MLLKNDQQILRVILLFLCLLVPQVGHAHDALRKLQPVSVVVRNLDNAYAVKAGITREKLQKVVEQTLRDAGVPLAENAETPQLEVSVNVANFFGGYAGSYRLELRDWAGSLKDPSRRLLVVTWEKGGLLTASKKKFRGQIETSLKELAGAFVDDFKAVN